MVAIHGSVVKSPLHSRCAFNSRVVGNPYLTGLRKGCPSSAQCGPESFKNPANARTA